jgi:NAD(P)-dependent dehydrogenase (short-subunit alcohol dehydrogenase family)
MQDVMSLEGKTIVVTGAAQGIRQAIASLAIGLGARVVGVDLNDSDRLTPRQANGVDIDAQEVDLDVAGC